MGKRKVLNESALKELQLPQEGEMFGRVIKLLGGENLLVKCAAVLQEEEELEEN